MPWDFSNSSIPLVSIPWPSFLGAFVPLPPTHGIGTYGCVQHSETIGPPLPKLVGSYYFLNPVPPTPSSPTCKTTMPPPRHYVVGTLHVASPSSSLACKTSMPPPRCPIGTSVIALPLASLQGINHVPTLSPSPTLETFVVPPPSSSLRISPNSCRMSKHVVIDLRSRLKKRCVTN